MIDLMLISVNGSLPDGIYDQQSKAGLWMVVGNPSTLTQVRETALMINTPLAMKLPSAGGKPMQSMVGKDALFALVVG